MRRLFLSLAPEGETVIVEGDEAHHGIHVLRLKSGDQVELFDGAGGVYTARVERVERGCIRFRIAEARQDASASPVTLTIACSVVKPKAMDLLVQKCTELGVSALWPCITDRTVVRPRAGDEKGVSKWRRAAIEAAKQCHRNVLPEIEPPRSFEQIIASSGARVLRMILSLSAEAKPLRELLPDAPPRRLLLFIGPEGGLTPEEETLASDAGFMPAALGPLVLRAETAAMAGAAAVLFRYGWFPAVDNPDSCP